MNQSEQLQKILSSPEGKKLLRLLNQDGGQAVRQAAGAAQRGDTRQVQSIMGPLLEDPEVQRLLKSLERSASDG